MGADGLPPAEADVPVEQPPLPDGTSEMDAAEQQPESSMQPSPAVVADAKSSAEDDFLLKASNSAWEPAFMNMSMT